MKRNGYELDWRKNDSRLRDHPKIQYSTVQRRRKRLLMEHRIAQDNLCYWCHNPMTNDWDTPTAATLEHVVRRADGGADNYENTRAACARCNSTRHHKELAARTIAAWESLAALECKPAQMKGRGRGDDLA